MAVVCPGSFPSTLGVFGSDVGSKDVCWLYAFRSTSPSWGCATPAVDATRTVDSMRPGGGGNHSKSMAPPNPAAGESGNHLGANEKVLILPLQGPLWWFQLLTVCLGRGAGLFLWFAAEDIAYGNVLGTH